MTDTELQSYLNAVKRQLVNVPSSRKSAFIADLSGNIQAYIEENPGADRQKVEGCFGSPAQIADSFLESEELPKIKREFSLRKKVLLVLVSVVAVAAVILGTIFVRDLHGFYHGHYDETMAYGTPPPPESGVVRY